MSVRRTGLVRQPCSMRRIGRTDADKPQVSGYPVRLKSGRSPVRSRPWPLSIVSVQSPKRPLNSRIAARRGEVYPAILSVRPRTMHDARPRRTHPTPPLPTKSQICWPTMTPDAPNAKPRGGSTPQPPAPFEPDTNGAAAATRNASMSLDAEGLEIRRLRHPTLIHKGSAHAGPPRATGKSTGVAIIGCVPSPSGTSTMPPPAPGPV
jgi:hypothetical protein